MLDAHESRFEPIKANYELLTKHHNTNQTVDFGRLKAREPFSKEKPEPSYEPKFA